MKTSALPNTIQGPYQIGKKIKTRSVNCNKLKNKNKYFIIKNESYEQEKFTRTHL